MFCHIRQGLVGMNPPRVRSMQRLLADGRAGDLDYCFIWFTSPSARFLAWRILNPTSYHQQIISGLADDTSTYAVSNGLSSSGYIDCSAAWRLMTMYSLDATLPIGRLTKFVHSIIKDPWIDKAALIEESCWFVGQRGLRHGADACMWHHDACASMHLMWVLRENLSLFYFSASLGGIFSFLVTLRDLHSNSLVEGPWPWGTFDTNSYTYTSLKVSTIQHKLAADKIDGWCFCM